MRSSATRICCWEGAESLPLPWRECRPQLESAAPELEEETSPPRLAEAGMPEAELDRERTGERMLRLPWVDREARGEDGGDDDSEKAGDGDEEGRCWLGARCALGDIEELGWEKMVRSAA